MIGIELEKSGKKNKTKIQAVKASMHLPTAGAVKLPGKFNALSNIQDPVNENLNLSMLFTTILYTIKFYSKASITLWHKIYE